MLRLSRRQDRVASKKHEKEEEPEKPGRLPLRWGLILLASSLAALMVGVTAGPAPAVAAWIAVAVGLDQILA